MPQSWRLAMSTLTRRQFNRTLMASVGSGWARDVVGNRASQANQQQTWAGSIADVPGIKAGHYTDSRRPTGCTALLFEGKGTAGVDYDGSAPGSHLGVLLQPVSPIDTIHGLLMTGGGPMGLSSVAGAVRYLEEHKTGLDRKSTRLNSNHRYTTYDIFCLIYITKYVNNKSDMDLAAKGLGAQE